MCISLSRLANPRAATYTILSVVHDTRSTAARQGGSLLYNDTTTQNSAKFSTSRRNDSLQWLLLHLTIMIMQVYFHLCCRNRVQRAFLVTVLFTLLF